MSDPARAIRTKVSALNESLDELEAQLQPLLAQTLPETLVGLETLQKAKLQVAIPYLVYDLVFIYLKTRGVDPKTHPVIAELDRIRQYFDKIKNAEDPEKRRVNLDKAAANRFIKHAIAQVQFGRPPGDNEGSSRSADVRMPVKVTTKMAARAEYEKDLKEMGSEEESDLEIIEDGEDAEEESGSERINIGTPSNKGKGKAVEMEVDEFIAEVGRKRRRPPVDPFAGYGDQPSTNPASDIPTPALKRRAEPGLDDIPSSGRSTPLSSSSVSKQAGRKSRKKKTKQAES